MAMRPNTSPLPDPAGNSQRLEVFNQCPPVFIGRDAGPEVVPLISASRPLGVKPIAILTVCTEQLRLVARLSYRNFKSQRLPHLRRIEFAGRKRAEHAGPFGHWAKQMVERRNAAVVQVGEVGPDAGQGCRRVALALAQLSFFRDRAALEGGDESGGDHFHARGIGADVRVEAGPLEIALAVICSVAGGAAELV